MRKDDEKLPCNPSEPSPAIMGIPANYVNPVINIAMPENHHKPSLNSVGSCISSSTDEGGCSTESPQHKIRPQIFPQQAVSLKLILDLIKVLIHRIQDDFLKSLIFVFESISALVFKQ